MRELWNGVLFIAYDEMLLWTKEEYLRFIPTMANKPYSYYAFELLYWCGIRMGELRALTAEDFDFEKNIVSITKSYQKIKGRDVITKPKTKKSIRQVYMPEQVAREMEDYINSIYGLQPDERLFPISKSYLHHEMDRGVKLSGVKRIRIHDLRHSHVCRSYGYFWDRLYFKPVPQRFWQLHEPLFHSDVSYRCD